MFNINVYAGPNRINGHISTGLSRLSLLRANKVHI